MIFRWFVKSKLGLCFWFALILTLMFIGSSSLLMADEWVRVATGGLGSSEERQPDAMEIFGNYVYLATHTNLGPGGQQPKIYRATLADDRLWHEFSPPWGTINTEVTDMLAFDDKLFVSNYAGQIWRLGGDGVWRNVTPDWPGSRIVHSMAPMLLTTGGDRICAVRGGIEIWCGPPSSEGAGWERISLPPRFGSDPSIGSAILRRFGRNLYLGVGGGSAGSRMCELWKLDTPSIFTTSVVWRPVTTDCFGFGYGLTWITAMAEFGSKLYIGTGGHGANAVLYRSNGRDLADVTPRDLYDFTNPFSPHPLRYGSIATNGENLFVGTRTTSGALRGADVIRMADEDGWAFSNEPGFGVSGNDAVTAMAGRDGYLYAGVLNLSNGLEVWRLARRPPVVVPLPTRPPRPVPGIRMQGCETRSLIVPIPRYAPLCRCLQDDSAREFRCTLLHPDPDFLLVFRIPAPILPGTLFDLSWTLIPLRKLPGDVYVGMNLPQDFKPKDKTSTVIRLPSTIGVDKSSRVTLSVLAPDKRGNYPINNRIIIPDAKGKKILDETIEFQVSVGKEGSSR
jgi:hypothetical protein